MQWLHFRGDVRTMAFGIRPRVIPALTLALPALGIMLVGCGPVGLGLIPGSGDLPAFSGRPFEGLDDFNQRVDDLPTIAVRIVNNTDAIARVSLSSAISGPDFGHGHFMMMDFDGADVLATVDGDSVLVDAGGTVTGELKCGEVITVSALAPFDADPFGHGGPGFGMAFGGGNVALTGIGGAEEGFDGDVISTVRVIRPGDGDLDCGVDTLVIQIDTASTRAVYDPDTGALIQGRQAGGGSIAVEASTPGT